MHFGDIAEMMFMNDLPVEVSSSPTLRRARSGRCRICDATGSFRVDVDRPSWRAVCGPDIASAIGNASFDAPTGTLTSQSQDLIVRASATITTPEAFEATILSGHTRLGDVASVSLGPDLGESALRANGRTGVGIGIVRQAGSNTLEISAGVRAAVEEIREILPEEVTIAVTSDDATFISQSIDEVLEALLLAIAIVVGVIYVFLCQCRGPRSFPAITPRRPDRCGCRDSGSPDCRSTSLPFWRW